MDHSSDTSLVLFDIDGTLLRRAGPAHRESLEHAVWRVARVRTTVDGIPVAGMLDREILRQMMSAGGMKPGEIRAAMPDVIEAAMRIYPRRCPDLSRKLCPGVRAFLRALARRGAVCGLVTGNLSRIGWTKMRRAGIEAHFRFGAFAEQGRTRAELARLAIREARKQGWIGRRSRIALVGDHPNDVAAARANSIVSVAVGTGVVSWEELTGSGPDLAVTDLRFLSPEILAP
ncbi:MAG: HAD family hydrolase [Bryobacteraceae bacterium]|nr:HAD family hydrolase [Bryobacteraceae bacterium]